MVDVEMFHQDVGTLIDVASRGSSREESRRLCAVAVVEPFAAGQNCKPSPNSRQRF